MNKRQKEILDKILRPYCFSKFTCVIKPDTNPRVFNSKYSSIEDFIKNVCPYWEECKKVNRSV